MTQEQIIKSLETAGALVSTLTGDAVVVAGAIVAIKGIIGMVVGQSLEAPEYAEAMRRGYERNRQKIGDRITELEGK